MNTKRLTSKEYFQTLQIIHLALLAGPVFFGVVTFVLNRSGKLNSGSNELRDIFIYIVPLFVIGGIFIGHSLFNSMLRTAKSLGNLSDKMNGYRSALIIRYAFLEGPAYFAIVVYFLTGDLLFLAMAGLIILIFLTIKPTPGKASKDLNLNLNDKQSIDDPNKVIAEMIVVKYN